MRLERGGILGNTLVLSGHCTGCRRPVTKEIEDIVDRFLKGKDKEEGNDSMTIDTTPVPGKLEITVKINELPEVQNVKNDWKSFLIAVDQGKMVQVTVKPKIWNKVLKAQEEFPMWVAAISGKLGKPIKGGGFELENPGIQVFEKKPKPPKEPKAPKSA